MNAIDIIFLIAMAVCVIAGFFKGIIRQVLTLVGIVVVASLTATVAPHVQKWLGGVVENENTRKVIAMIAAALLLAVAYGLVALILTKILRKLKVIGVLDRILGGILGFAEVYLLFAVLFALFNDTADGFLPLLKKAVGQSFRESWVGAHIYANNFFGHWIIVDIAQKILDSLAPSV